MGLGPFLAPACLTLTLLAAGILVEAQLPGSASVQTLSVLSPTTLDYECDGTTFTATVAGLPATPNIVVATESRLIVEPVSPETSRGPREVFQFFLFEQGSLSPDLAQDVFQIKNAQNGLCWTSASLGSTLEQEACATDISTIDSAATRRQLFVLSLVHKIGSCGGSDGVYRILSTFDFVNNPLDGQNTALAATPAPDTHAALTLDLAWQPPSPASDFFITTRSFTQ